MGGNLLLEQRQLRYWWCFVWWRHQMETFSASLALCVGNSPVIGEFPSQSPVARSFGVFFDLGLNKRLSKQSRRRWFETPSRPLWRHCNGNTFRLCITWNERLGSSFWYFTFYRISDEIKKYKSKYSREEYRCHPSLTITATATVRPLCVLCASSRL